MLKLRHGFVVAIVALLSGCPEATDDARMPRLLKGDVSVEAGFEPDEYVCTNIRRWREKGEDGKNLDMPDYLTETAPDIDGKNDEENRREAHRKDYLKYHEGILTICRTPLVKDAGANRGTCPVCTAMLNDPKYMDAQHTSAKEAPEADPIKLETAQIFRTKVEYRLKAAKEDYLTDPGQQEESFRSWLKDRNTPADQIEKLVGIERGKSVWSDPKASPPRTTTIVKYGLPPLAEPLIRCPTCKKPLNPAEPRCWNCSHYYTATARDEHNSILEPLEFLCPWDKTPLQAVDPTTNYCKKCEKFFRAVDRDGPCWRCGGSHVCPECNGSGKNQSPPVYNATGGLVTGSDECYYCGKGTLGVCPECDTHGFAMYEGVLPPGWRADRRKADDWRLKPAGSARPAGGGDRAPAAPSGGDEGGDKPEKDK
jgi:hypothetical protein